MSKQHDSTSDTIPAADEPGDRSEDRTEDVAAQDTSQALTLAATFGDVMKVKRPNAAQIADAIEQTPTLEDRQRPNIPVPSYLKTTDASDSASLRGVVGEKPGFTNAPNHDPTLVDPSLELGERPGRSSRGSSKGIVLLALIGLAAVIALVWALRL